MITFVRTFGYGPDKTADVMSLTRQSKRFLKKRYGVDLSARLPIGGAPNRMAHVIAFRDLADLESLVLNLASDPEYRKLVLAIARHILPGSIQDEIWREVDPHEPAAPVS